MDYSIEIRNGEKLYSDGNIDQAKTIFQSVLLKQPSNYMALNNLGVIFFNDGDIEAAEKYFLQAIAADEDYTDAMLNLALLFTESNKIEKACLYLENYTRINPDDNLYETLSQLYSGLGNQTKAKQYSEISKKRKSEPEVGKKICYSLKKNQSHSNIDVLVQPLNILFVQDSPCIRNYKMATALRPRGHRVSLAYTMKRLSESYSGLSDETYDECIQLTSYRHLWEISKNYDLVHCHNEPDNLTVAALAGDAPVIHDTHDLISLRDTQSPDLSYLEGIANRAASGRVYSTPYQRDEAKTLYGVNGPSLIFYNYVSESDLSKIYLPKLSINDGEIHIVYEGGIGGSTHRDFTDTFIQLTNKKIHIHVYPTSYCREHEQFFSKFPRIHYYQPVSPKKIIEEMTQYDFGIIPFNIKNGNKRFLDSTIANKLFEYLAAGLPVITSPLKSYIDFFLKYPVGIVFECADDMLKNITQLREITRKTDFSKLIYTYESEIEKLEEFYRTILKS